MATLKTPIRTVYDNSNSPIGLAEFQTGEVVPVIHGGTGANTVAEAKLNLSLTDSNIRSLISVSGGGSYNNSTGVITINSTDLTPYATITHVTNEISNVVGAAPGVLDTLNELAAAINDDASFYTTINNSIGASRNQANTAYDRANVAVTYAGSAFDKANTLVATVAGVSSTSISNTNLLDGIKSVDGSSSGLDSDFLDGQDGSYYLDWTNVTNKPDPTITVQLTGDVSGSASATLSDLGSNTITISTTIQNNSIVLGTDTTGDYVQNVIPGTGIAISGTPGESRDATITLDTSGVSASTYGGASKVPVLTIDQYGRITSAANVNVAGVTNFTASGNTFTIGTADGGTFSASIQTNSVRLSTDTTGDYVQNVLPGAGIEVSGAVGEGRDATIALTTSGVAATTYGGASKVPVLTIDQYGRITSAANVNVAGVTNFAASGNTFTISTADGGSFSASIQLDSVRLGTDTTGAYVSNLIAGTGVTLTGLGNEGTTPTIAIGQAVSTTSDVTFRDVVVSGNLTVSGTQTIINTNVIELADNQITLNSDHTGSPTQDAGIVVNRGTSANVSIFWDETNDRWSLNNSSATYIVHNTGRDVVLGTETSGNYVATVAAGTGISTTGASSGEGIAHSISLATSGVSASTYGGAAVQPVLTVDTYGRITSASNVTSTVANTNITGNIIGSQIAATGVTASTYGGADRVSVFTVDQQGRLTSASNVVISIPSSAINTDVALGSQTSGNYVATLAAGTGISTTGASSGEGIAHSISLATSGVSAATYGGAGTQIPTLAIDTYGRVTSAANVAINTIKLSAFAATTSAELAGVISDETGSGSLVFANSPTLITPDLGTPSSVVLTNATGTAANLTANIANYINVTDDTSTNATRYPIFANGTSGAVVENVSSTKLTFNPSTGLLTSTDYNSSSDKRLKKEVKTIQSALDKVNDLRGVSFVWKEGNQKSFGLIAQEVEKVLPEVVSTDESGYLGIRYNNIIGILVEAIKEQQKQIDELKSKL